LVTSLALNNIVFSSLRKPSNLPAMDEVVSKDFATHDLLLMLSGNRIFASDVAMLELIIAYGDHESDSSQVASITRRLMGLDPFFRYGIVFGIAALAFDLVDDKEAVRLIHQALQRDGNHWDYSLYLSSISYKKSQNYAGEVEELEKVRKRQDCPTMLKNIVANLYVKLGRIPEAIGVFEEMLSAPQEEYRNLAQKKLEKLRRIQ